MDNSLSSIGVYNADFSNITSDNATIFSSLHVSGVNILSSLSTMNSNLSTINFNLSTINSNLSSVNNNIYSTQSSLNVCNSNEIDFYCGATFITNINLSGLNVFTNGRNTFPFTPSGYYNISERLDQLVLVMQDTAIPIITYDPDNNTKIRIRQADFYSDLYPAKNYPKQIQFCDFLNKKVGYFNTSGLNLLDVNGNYNNISSYFTQTGNSLLLCSNKTMVDAGGNLNVFHMTTNTILGTMYTGGTWLNVSDTLNTTAVLSNNYSTVLSQLSTITGSIDNISNIGNYYAALQTTLAAINGIITGVGLILAFNFKEDKFDVQYPLSKRTPTGGEYFNKLSLKYGGSLTLDSNNSLAVNTVEFLTPIYGDLGLMPTPNGITSTSTSYVVVGRLSQPITCNSSLNVSGVTTLSNNTTINGTLNVMGTNTFQGASTHLSSLNVSGAFTCNALSALSATIPSILFTTSSTTINNPNTTIPSILMVSGNTSFNSGINITGRTIIGNDIYNYSDSVFETYKNIAVRKNVPNVGDRIELKCGLGTTSTYLSMEEGYDINLSSLNGGVFLNSYATRGSIGLNAQTVNISNDLKVQGYLKCYNQGQRIPIYFTTNRTINLNNTTFSCYDIDLNLYTNPMLLDGYNIRQFRIRTWLSDADFQNPNLLMNSYSIFMSDRNGLSIFAHGSPFDNPYLDISYLNQFLYRNSFNTLTYCSRYGARKIYCIIEDLL